MKLELFEIPTWALGKVISVVSGSSWFSPVQHFDFFQSFFINRPGIVGRSNITKH